VVGEGLGDGTHGSISNINTKNISRDDQTEKSLCKQKSVYDYQWSGSVCLTREDVQGL
jgi:hypothetical protein